MKRIKFARQFNIAYALTFVIVLTGVNYLFHQHQGMIHQSHQKKICELIFSSLASNLEYGLSFGDKSDLKQTLFPLRNNPDIAFVRVIDNQKTVVSEVDNRSMIGIPITTEISTINKDIVQRISSGFYTNFPNQLTKNNELSNRKLGQIQIATTPFQYSRFNSGYKQLSLNLVIIIPMLLFWIYLRIRQNHQAKIAKKLINILNDSESYKEFQNNLKTKEGSELLHAVENQVIKSQNLHHQLNLLNTEIQTARLDADTELHEFIGFITQQDFDSSLNNLMLFYKIIKQPVGQNRNAVYSRDLLAETLTDLSALAKEHNTLIQDTFSGNRMGYQAHVDQAALRQMLKLLLKQVIIICNNKTLDIHFDVREDYKEMATLRISLSSSATDFLEAIETQSLFQFKEDLPVTTHSNNIQLISAKHILRKFGGEYFYFNREVRLEIPLTTINIPDKKTQPAPVAPLDIELNTLVYDSDPIDKMVLIGYLAKLGIEVDKATTKQVVLQKIRHDNYNAILVDSHFISDDPSFSFKHFLEEMDQLENKPKIIIVSHDISVTESEAFQQLDNPLFVTKPVDPQKLAKVLTAL